MISVNDILIMKDEEKEYRVLWVSRDTDIAYIFDLSCVDMPVVLPLGQLEQQLLDGTIFRSTKDKYLKAAPASEIFEKEKVARDSTWSLVKDLVTQEPAVFERRQRGILIAQIVKTTGKSRKVFYRYLKLYWQRGKTINAFLPDFRNRGPKGQALASQDKKIGRPSKYGETVGRNVDEAIAEIFEKAVKKYYHTRREHSFKAAYELMVKDYFTKPVVGADGTTQLEVLDANEVPTLRQFRYWYSKQYDAKEKLSSRKGQKKYELNHRAILGKSDSHIHGPGAQFQIDATVGDIYLVSRFNRANIIGRPVIYFIIDTFSRMVTGMYVGLEGPSWAGAMMALANAASDKVFFCEKYGITITDYEWPCHHIPDTILADRGEMEGKSVETLINALNIRVDNAPAYRADMKGIVEQFFHTINTKTTVFLPGHVKPDMAQRGGKDYRLDAKLDIYQFTKVMVQCVLNHNNAHFLEGYERTEEMIADDVEPIPLKLWNWGIKHCHGQLRSVTEDTVKLCLMPADTALVTARGIRFKGLYYLNERAIFEHWFEAARAKGSYRVDVSYDPRDMSSIYIRNLDGGMFEKCYLSEHENKWNGKFLDEVIHQQAADRSMRSKDAGRELQARVDLNTEIEKIVCEAEQMAKQTIIPSSKRERTSSIRGNRAVEKQALRQGEAFVLGEEPMVPPLEPEKPKKPLSPTLAMIKRKVEERLNDDKK